MFLLKAIIITALIYGMEWLLFFIDSMSRKPTNDKMIAPSVYGVLSVLVGVCAAIGV